MLWFTTYLRQGSSIKVHVLRDPASIVITQLFTIRTSDFKAHMRATKSALAPGAKNRAPSPTVRLLSFAFYFGS
jgi:hypothetical protein